MISFRPLTEDDLDLLAGFLGAPHVAAWWHEPTDLGLLRSKYLADSSSTNLLVLEDDREIGFAQWYLWTEEDAGYYGLPAGSVGFDYLIGHPRDCDRGLGSQLIAALLQIVPDRDVWVTPEEANGPSCRVLDNNGFELMAVKQCQVPDEPWAGPTALYRRSAGAPTG